MDIKRLQSFCKVYELRSFSLAGKDLFLSQPSVSAHVAALEDELGVVLFDRLGREVQATLAGKLLYDYAQQMLRLMESAVSELSELKDQISGQLMLGGSSIPAVYLLPEIMAEFFLLYPKVNLTLCKGDSYEIINKVSQGVIDLGVVGTKVDEFDCLEFVELMGDELLIVGAAHVFSDLAERKEFSELASYPWVMREHGSGTRASFENIIGHNKFDKEDLNIVAIIYDTESQVRAVLQGLGITVVSRLAVDNLLRENRLVGCTLVDFDFKRSIYLVYHKKRVLFPASRRFIEFLRDSCQTKHNKKYHHPD